LEREEEEEEEHDEEEKGGEEKKEEEEVKKKKKTKKKRSSNFLSRMASKFRAKSAFRQAQGAPPPPIASLCPDTGTSRRKMRMKQAMVQ
jgi:hypothetical protein